MILYNANQFLYSATKIGTKLHLEKANYTESVEEFLWICLSSVIELELLIKNEATK